jgi:hypothetical protein
MFCTSVCRFAAIIGTLSKYFSWNLFYRKPGVTIPDCENFLKAEETKATTETPIYDT